MAEEKCLGPSGLWHGLEQVQVLFISALMRLFKNVLFFYQALTIEYDGTAVYSRTS